MTVGTAPGLVIAPAFTADDLVAVAGQVWESCLAHHPDVLVEGAVASLEGPVTRASVTITGGWSGVVVLEMDSATAQEAARVMLDLEEVDDVAPEEVGDAVGEVPRRAAGPAREAVRSCPTMALRLHD